MEIRRHVLRGALQTFLFVLLLTLFLPAAGRTLAVKAEQPSGGELAGEAETGTEKNGEVMILVTSDTHCGIDMGFGFAGLAQIRDTLEQQGYTTLLVDDGDAVQGEAIGTLTQGQAIVELMNALHYDAAIPGNHEFDYGMEEFLALAEKAEYPYISCNFNKEGELVFSPYIIREACGMKIAFVGVTTPQTLTTSTPSHFMNGKGEFIYGFFQDMTGEALYEAVQKAVDDARGEGADYVYLLAHLGYGATFSPWSYADVISNTTGIDVVLDGHSHDTEQVVMKNKNGENVTRCAVGTKMSCIGYSRITADGIQETGIYSWPNSTPAPELLNIQNEVGDLVKEANTELEEQLAEVVAKTDVEMTINDPVEKDASGNPIRMIRRAETNLGDLCADAIRVEIGSDVGIINGGGVRASIAKGDVTFGDIINVQPFGNGVCEVEVTGQQILDALEWGARDLPDENGGFLQISGLTCEIDVNVPSGCIADENDMCIGIEGERRVRNVMIGEEPLDPEKTYTLAGSDYILLEDGSGHTAFRGAPLLQDRVKLDNQVMIDYIVDTLGGVIGEAYADPYGDGRITIID